MSLERPEVPSAEWRETFADICDRHRSRLVRWLSAIFGARDAEDIAQETLTRLCERPDLLETGRDPWPWLAVVSRNVGRDLARRNARSLAVDATVLADVADPVVVADQVVARDEGARLAEALRGLSTRERAVIKMRDFQGMAMTDIADMLGATENAVRQQLYRARRRLADAYLDLGGDRQPGFVTLVGLRVRELARRLNPYADTAGGAATAAAVLAAPALAAAVAGTLAGVLPGLHGTPHDRTPAPAVAYAAAVASPPGVVPVSVPGRPVVRVPATVTRLPQPRPTYTKDVGPVHVHSEYDPYDAGHDQYNDYGIDTPFGWWGIHEHGHPGEGPTLHCRLFPDDPRCA
jgi:RNA polymerase sigma-70 factor (ECF subfamily)